MNKPTPRTRAEHVYHMNKPMQYTRIQRGRNKAASKKFIRTHRRILQRRLKLSTYLWLRSVCRVV
jgi:hypothetical protein